MFESDFIQKTLTPTLAIIGALFGLIGTLLGILNYRLSRKRDRIDLRVSGMSRLTLSNKNFESVDLEIKIVNAGYVAVTIGKVGLQIKLGHFRYKDAPLDPEAPANIATRPDIVPKRIEPHDEVVIRKRLTRVAFFKLVKETFPLIEQANAVYVVTSTGKRFYAKGPFLERFVATAKENAANLIK